MTRLDGSINPAFDTRLKITATHETRPGELGVIAATPLHARSVANIRKIPLTPEQHDLIYAKCKAAQKTLTATIKDFLENDGADVSIDIDPDEAHKIEDLEGFLTRAKDALVAADDGYTGKEKGRVGRIRRAFRRFGDHAKDGKFFVALIPSENSYLSVLAGGLKLICAAAERLGVIRQAIVAALEEIPTVLNEKGALMNLLERLTRTEELHKSNASLSQAILEAVDAMIRWLTKNPFKKTVKAFAAPATAGEREITDRIAVLRKKAGDFHNFAMISCSEINFQNHDQLKALLALMHDDSSRDSWIIQRQNSNMIKEVSSLKQTVNAQAQAIDSLHGLLVSENRHPRREGSALRKGLPPGKKPPKLKFKAESLLDELDFDPLELAEDCERLLELRYTLPYAEQDRAVVLMQHPDFISWLGSDESSALLVHGRDRHALKCATSFVCAKLVDLLNLKASIERSQIVPLNFFCGLHNDESNDVHAHPPGMCKSLLLQLIDRLAAREKLDSRPLQHEIGMLDVDDVNSVLGLFCRVVEHMSRDAHLYVVIDAVSYYENRGREDEMMEAINKLVELVRNVDRPVVKVLMASPASTRSAWRMFRLGEERVQVLDMRRTYLNRGGFRALGWTDSIDRGIAEVDDGSEEYGDEG